MLDWDYIRGRKDKEDDEVNYSNLDWDSIRGRTSKKNKTITNIKEEINVLKDVGIPKNYYSKEGISVSPKYEGWSEEDILADRRKKIVDTPVKQEPAKMPTLKNKSNGENNINSPLVSSANILINQIKTQNKANITNLGEKQKESATKLYEARKEQGIQKEEYLKQYKKLYDEAKSTIEKEINKVNDKSGKIHNVDKYTLPKANRIASNEEIKNSKSLKTGIDPIDNLNSILGGIKVGIASAIPNAANYINEFKEWGINKVGSEVLKNAGMPDKAAETLMNRTVEILNEKNRKDIENFKKWKNSETIINKTRATNKTIEKGSELMQSVGENIIPAVLTAVNPVAGTSLFMTSAAGNYLEDAESRGMNKDQALAYATVMGIVEGGTEGLITGSMYSKLRKFFTGTGVSKKILESYGVNLTENFLQEFSTEYIQEKSAEIIGGKDKADWNNIFTRMINAGIDGILTAILLDGIATGITNTEFILSNKTTQKEFNNEISKIINSEKINVNDIINGATEAIKQHERKYTMPVYEGNNIADVIKVKGQPINIPNNKLNRQLAVVNIDDGYVTIDADTGTRLDGVYQSKFEAIKSITNKINGLESFQVNILRKRINEVQKQIERETAITELNNKTAENISQNENNIIKQDEYKDAAIKEVKNSYLSAENKTEILNTINSINNISKDDLESIKTTINKINEFDLPTNANYKNDTERKQKYLKYKNDNSDYDSKVVKEVLDTIPTNRNGRRTVKQWLKAADEIGKRIANKSNPEIERIAYKSWFDLQPIKNITRYDNQTKTNQAFQKLTSDEWINTINNAIIEERNNNTNIIKEGNLDSTNILENDIVKNESPSFKKSVSKKETKVKNTNNAILENSNVKNSKGKIEDAIIQFEKAKGNVNRQIIINIINNLNIKLKNNAIKTNSTEMAKRAGKNKFPNIVAITEFFNNLTNQNARDFRNDAIIKALDLFRDEEVIIKDTNSVSEINKSGIEKTYSGNVTEEKIQTVDNLKEIIEEGIYGFSSYNPTDKNAILYHHFFAPIVYKGKNGLIRVVIKEFTKDNTLKDKFYYHQLEYISNKKIEDIVSALPQLNGNKDFETTSSNINNSISQKNTSVKKETTVNNKDMQKEKNNTNIQDFGEKIGGARKDTSIPKTINTNNKEVIHDYTVSKNDNGYVVEFKKKVLKEGFSTQEEAEQYVLDFKDSIKSNLAYVREGTNGQNESVYIIMLRNPRTLKTEMTGKQFKNKQDAESYAIALSMYLKEHNKNLFRPQLQKITRINNNIQNSTKATGENILNDFNFRGGEFGNWVTQKERQEFLNYAQDAFIDLATALGIESKDLGQNRQMAIAFGARGKGLSAAVAHFEPMKKVINMTRLKGAGSLAHEYGHSIDNWLSRLGGYDENGMVTTNYRNPNLSENMKKAINDVRESLQYSISKDTTEILRKNEIFEKNRIKSLQEHMNYLDKIFDDKATKYQYNRRTKQREQQTIITTEKQKKEYKKIKNILLEGKLKGEVERKINPSTLKTDTVYPKEIETIRSMFKEIMGRKIDEDMLYWLNRYGRPSKQLTEIKSQSAFYKSALELDKMMGRKTMYFAKIEEMWARAFESYIYDKLKAKGITNTYLVHSVNNSDYALFNPYPAGEERQNINKAFDNLFKVMKEENKLHSNNEDIRYMKKRIKENKNVYDNKGNELTKAQQEYFKNSKLRNEKNELEIVYHSTPNLFTEFDDGKLGDNTLYGNTAFGHFVTTNKKFSERFKDIDNKGTKGYTMEMYANIEKPITHPYNADYKYSGNQLDDIVRNYLKAINETEALKELEENAKDEEISLYEMYMGVAMSDEVFEYAKDEREILRKKGYDAVEFVEGMEKDVIKGSKSIEPVISYAIFNAKQLKMVTNKNPASNEDVRYMKKEKINNNSNNMQKENIKYDKKNIKKDPKRNAERADAYIEQEIRKIEETGEWDNSIPVTKLSDIRKILEDYLGLGIKRGQFRQRAYALYKTNRDLIRTKELKDMDSILHEVGHALDSGKRLNIDKENISDELFRAINKLGGYENDSIQVKLEEGFAEVLRMYAIVPEQASKEYPNTINTIKLIRKNDKSFDKFMNNLQTQIYNYIHQNPANRNISNMSIGENTDKPKYSKEWWKQEIIRNVWDSDYNLKVATEELARKQGKTINSIKPSQNAYILTRLASGVTDKVISMLSDGIIDENGNKLTPGLKKVGEILGNDSKRYIDLRNYLFAQSDLQYKDKGLKSGLRTNDSKAVVEQFNKDSQIKEAAQVIYDTLDGVLQYTVDNHLIDEKIAENLRKSNTFYVPMHRVFENQGNKTGKRGAVKDIIQKRVGSERDVKDILENVISNSANMIQQVENNNILKALYNEGETSGITGSVYDVIPAPLMKVGTANLEMWKTELKKQGVKVDDIDLSKTVDIFAPNNKVDTKKLITSFINDRGERIYLQFNDELIFNSVMNMDKKMMSMFLEFNKVANLPLRFGATMGNIGFSIPNMISDTAQASIYSTAGFIPVLDNAIGIINILAADNKIAQKFINRINPQLVKKNELLYQLWKQTGSTSSTRLSQYRDSTQKLMKEVYGVNKSQTIGINERFKPLKRLLDILTFIPELSEQSTRFRVFEKNYNYFLNKGYSEQDARILAALESRDATQDFGRTGNLTREINQIIPFSSARVGSIYTAQEKVKANTKKIAARTALLLTLAIIIKSMGYDDKEVEELNQRKKDDNFVLKIGDTIHTIKKPQGILRSIINLTEYIQDLFTGHVEEGKEGERLGKWINNAIMDNMPTDEITGLVPNAVAPIIENTINKDLYYNNEIVKTYDLDLPDKDQYYDYNSQLAILLGRVFNYSPAKIDNLISGYFAGLGTDTTKMMDYAMGKIGLIPEKPEMGAEDNPIGKRFVVNVNNYSISVDEIYNKRTELNKKKNGGIITENETEELEKINSAISNISKINKQIKEIKSDLKTSGKQKAEQIRVLQQERTDIARQALGKELINNTNNSKIESTQFYPITSDLKNNKKVLTMTSEMKKEYEKIAYTKYQEYKKQGLYTDEKCISGAKTYAKKQMFDKYSDLVK